MTDDLTGTVISEVEHALFECKQLWYHPADAHARAVGYSKNVKELAEHIGTYIAPIFQKTLDEYKAFRKAILDHGYASLAYPGAHLSEVREKKDEPIVLYPLSENLQRVQKVVEARSELEEEV